MVTASERFRQQLAAERAAATQPPTIGVVPVPAEAWSAWGDNAVVTHTGPKAEITHPPSQVDPIRAERLPLQLCDFSDNDIDATTAVARVSDRE